MSERVSHMVLVTEQRCSNLRAKAIIHHLPLTVSVLADLSPSLVKST